MKWIGQIVQFIRRVMRKVSRDRVRAHSAEAAFFIIMSFFPVLMLLLTMIQFTPLNADQVLYAIEGLTPIELTGILKPVVDSLFNKSSALVSTTAIVALWAGGKGIMGLSDGLNSIYQISETRNYFVTRFRSACYTVVMILALILSLGVLVFGYSIQAWLRDRFPLMEKYSGTMLILPFAIAMGALILLFLVLYTFLPNRRMKMRQQVPGAIFSAVAWSVFSYAFSIYLDFAVNMSVLYGSLTTLIVIMLWLYCCMYLLFLGAELNHFLAHPELF